MNQSPNAAAAENPWKQSETLPRPGAGPLALACVLYGLGSLAIPLSFLQPWIAMVFWALLMVGGFYLTRRVTSGAKLTLAAAALACLVGLFIPAFGAVITALAIGLLGGAFFQTCTRQFWVLGLISAAATAGVFALTRDWTFCLLAVSLLPASLLLGAATRRGAYRTTAVGLALGGFLLWGLVLFLCWVGRTTGSVGLGAIRSVLNDWQNTLIQTQISWRDEHIAVFRETIADNPSWNAAQVANVEALIDVVMERMSDANIADSVAWIFNLLPGVVFALCAIPAFLGQKMLNAAYATNGMGRVITPEAEFFTMSVPAAVLYIVSMAVMLLFPSSFSIPVIVASNLCIMLMPGFLVLGTRFLFNRFFSAGGNARWVPVVIAAFLLCCLAYNAVFLGALLGAYERIYRAVRRRMAEKFKNQDSDNDHSDDSF